MAVLTASEGELCAMVDKIGPSRTASETVTIYPPHSAGGHGGPRVSGERTCHAWCHTFLRPARTFPSED
jgi:hypothetical protein